MIVLDLAYKHWYEYLIKNNQCTLPDWSFDNYLDKILIGKYI